MSHDPQAVLRRWFAAAAIVAFIAGVAVALTLLRPKPQSLPALRGADQPTTFSGGGQAPSQPGPAGGQGTTKPDAPQVTMPSGIPPSPAFSTAAPVPPKPRQVDQEGAVIPWGGSTAGKTVLLELQAVDRERIAGSTFYLVRNDLPIEAPPRGDFTARLSELVPGNYRWSALLELRGGTELMRVEPPRGDPAAADFVVVPSHPSIERLVQLDLDGKPLASNRRADGSVRLGVELKEEYASAVLEVEVKPAAVAFDGEQLLRTAMRTDVADVRFAGPSGPYRWRARIAPPGRQPTAWRPAQAGSNYDFALFSAPPSRPPLSKEPNPPPPPSPGARPPSVEDKAAPTSPSPKERAAPPLGPGERPPSATAGAGAGSGGLPQGRSDPLPSQQVEQASFWQIAFMRLLMGLGAMAAGLGVLALALSGIRRLLGRS